MKERDDLRSQVGQLIGSRKLIMPGDRVLAAFSGGPDSLCLLHVLNGLSSELKFGLTACHVNHNLRGKASQRDSAWAKKLALSWGIKLVEKNVDVKAYSRKNKLSLETAARDLRREVLLEAAREQKCNRIATGHNLDDQAETVLMHLIRGSGLSGLAGIPPANGPFIRPLLGCSRNLIAGYLKRNGLAGRKDASNASQKYFRNRIRHQLLPLLEEYNPRIKRSLSHLAGNVERDLEIINGQVEKAFDSCARPGGGKIAIDLSKFKLYNKGLQHNILRRCSEALLGPGQVPDSLHTDRAAELVLNGRTGAEIDLSGGLLVERTYGRALVSLKKRGVKSRPRTHQSINQALKIPGITRAGKHSIRAWMTEKSEICDLAKSPPRLAYFDAAILEGEPLDLTARKEGDRMVPFGSSSPKKVKDLFIEAKVPRERRAGWPLVRKGGAVVWLCGIRRSHSYPVTSKTRKVLCLKFIEN